MRSETLPIVEVAKAALPRRGRREDSGIAQDTSGSIRTNLARPWSFPAAHADSILCRRHPRSCVQVPVDITLVRPDGSAYDKGTGVIRDLSYSGVRLGDVVLTRGGFLAPYFGVELRPALESPGGHGIAGRILRNTSPGFSGFGIKFLFPESGVEERLRRMRGVEAADPVA